MRVFLCSYGIFSLAIPMDFVSSIFIFADRIEKKIQHNAEDGNTYISLPLVFNCQQIDVQHGIIMKYGSETEDKIILLSSRIESEKEIMREYFHPIPKALAVMQFSYIFSGIFFNAKDMILLLNPEHLIQHIQKEYK